MTPISGWGRYPRIATEMLGAQDAAQAGRLIAEREGVVARGCGRAYGDAAIGACATLATAGLSRMQAFDPESGLLRVEAGVTLSDILADFVPRGFFPPVVPGTRHVTVGGMIAADVHGKNHHRDGGFGAHVERLTLLLGDGTVRLCSWSENPELFGATIGGMGLTGTILDATFRMRPIETGWIVQETRVADGLSAMLGDLAASADSTYSVAWIDCLARGAGLGRGLVYRGEHARRRAIDHNRPVYPGLNARARAVPFDLPSFALNRWSVGAFNALYRRRGAAGAGAPFLVPWQSYFFPLDGLAQWNRLYGPRGFLQHQCVIPLARAEPVLAEILERVAKLGSASPLAVLKQLGAGEGVMSFPMPGYTLALDLPASAPAFALLDEIDRLVVAAGGRLYLAKDARQSRTTFEAGYAGLARFRALRRDLGVERASQSHLSLRLGI